MGILGARAACYGAFVAWICQSQWVEPIRNRTKNRLQGVDLLLFSMN